MKSILIQKTETVLLFPIVAMLMLLLSPSIYSNINTGDYEAGKVRQDTTLQVSIIIVGKVVDQDQNALDGVIVKENNTTTEVVTDHQGKFQLTLNKTTVISFTKIGFYSVDHKVAKSDSNMLVILTSKSNELIVHGFDNPKDSTTEYKWDLNFRDTTETTLQPLYIIDDVKMKLGYDINALNPADIKSVSVLKDASAMNLYKSDAKNGVVIITTKNYFDNASDKLKKTIGTDSISTLEMKYKHRTDSIEKVKSTKINNLNDSTEIEGVEK